MHFANAKRVTSRARETVKDVCCILINPFINNDMILNKLKVCRNQTEHLIISNGTNLAIYQEL